MFEIITVVLLFLDVNGNNKFDSKDVLIELNGPQIAYCITDDTKEVKPCWYIEENKGEIASLIKEKDLSQENIFFTVENFSKNKQKSVGNLFLWKRDDKYILTNDSHNKFDEYYYVTSSADQEKNTGYEILQKSALIWLGVFLTWLLLFPKKEIKNEK